MSYSLELWRAAESIYGAILAHPFIHGLTDGTLEHESFKFYIVQDAHYLRYFAQSLSLAAAKAPSDEWLVTFNQHANEAMQVERALHGSFFTEFGLSAAEVWSTALAPTNLAYTRYLLATVYARPFHEALGALLPCYWIYWEVGKQLEREGSPDPLYQRWINTYASAAYGATVRQVLALTDQIAATLTPAQRQAMCEHFVITARYEWMFWQMGYSREQWPV
jgi:thiaminase/transcriptional activator TenA